MERRKEEEEEEEEEGRPRTRARKGWREGHSWLNPHSQPLGKILSFSEDLKTFEGSLSRDPFHKILSKYIFLNLLSPLGLLMYSYV